MPYNIPWDETTPVGSTTPANTLDTIIQDLKEAISERITEVIPDWDNDGVQPKTIDGATIATDSDIFANRPVGTVTGQTFYATDREVLYLYDGTDWEVLTIYAAVAASLPATPSSKGEVFIATDTGVFYYNDGGSWEQHGVQSDTFASRPANPTGPNHLFYASDREQLFMPEGTAWKAVSPFVDVIANLPATPEGLGDMFISTDDGQVLINDGLGAWQLLVPSRYAASISRTLSNQSITDSNPTAVQFDTVEFEYFDTTLVDLGTNNTRITVPVEGVYLVIFQVGWDAADARGYRNIDIRINGAVVQHGSQDGWGMDLSAFTVTGGSTDRALNPGTDTLNQGLDVLGTLIQDLQAYETIADYQTTAVLLTLAASAYVEGYVFQKNPGASAVDVLGTTTTPCRLQAIMLSGRP